jgi:hypothetical protein
MAKPTGAICTLDCAYCFILKKESRYPGSKFRMSDAVLESYGQDRTPERDDHGRPTGRIRHVLKVFLVDRAGFIRNVYSAGFLVPELVLNDIRTVLGAR